jgi:hypothetical protein
MKVKEIMERANIPQTGRALAYIKDGLEEMQLITPTHTKNALIDINENERFYELPNEAIQILNVQCKNHGNASDLFKEIPRMIYEPGVTDEDGQ